MISEGRSYFAKVNERMEMLEAAIDASNYGLMERCISRLAKYVYMFDDEQKAVYEEALHLLESPDEDEYEPSEHDEWMSYDPDC
jgi:hypothetical protein